MSFGERMGEIRSGFEPAFWVANFTEIFERIAYYGTQAVLAIYLSEQLHFSSVLTGTLLGIAGFVVYALAILAGALADRFGFRRTLMCAYLVLTAGYFLLGSLETSWMAPLRNAVGDTWLVSLVLLVPALGPGMVKPCVAGTIARASTENVRSLGYSIYYTLVNVGGAIGPMMAWLIRKHLGLGIPDVFRAAATSVFLMFWVVLFFYREPGSADEQRVTSIWAAFKNMFVVLANLRFVAFLAGVLGFLYRLLADLDLDAAFHATVRRRECGRGPRPFHRSHHRDLLPDSRDVSDEKNACRTGDSARFPDLRFGISISRHTSERAEPGADAGRAGAWRNYAGVALLRILFPSRASGTARRLHGVCVPADRNRLCGCGSARRIPRARIRRSTAPPAADVVGGYGDWRFYCRGDVDL